MSDKWERLANELRVTQEEVDELCKVVSEEDVSAAFDLMAEVDTTTTRQEYDEWAERVGTL